MKLLKITRKPTNGTIGEINNIEIDEFKNVVIIEF